MFFGLCNYNGFFVRHFADIAATLYGILCKKIPYHWTGTEKSAMRSLCTALCSHPVLSLPDFTKPFCIESNESETAAGSVLTQDHTSVHKPIAFLNKTLDRSE